MKGYGSEPHRCRQTSETAAPRARRPHLERATEPLERAPFPARPHLDLSIGQVVHPTAEPEAPRLLTHEPPKPHALHAAARPHVKVHHDCCSPAVRAKSGTKRTGAISRVSTPPFRCADELEFLLVAVADGNEQAPAVGELIDQRLRKRGRAGADENRIVRRVLAPAERAVAEQQRDVAHAGLA